MTERTISALTGRTLAGLLWTDQKIYVETANRTSNPDLYMGLELEIEGWGRGSQYPGLAMQTDNSLRNNGVEWVTYPTKMKHLEHLLLGFYRKFQITEGNYSERCSTHVHVNVQDFTPTQLTTLLLVYQLVERMLFRFVGNDRDSNIFCVPWYQAGNTFELVERIKNWDAHHIHNWQKYTALNLLAIEQRGTVEYRHLEGTCDVKRIMTWCNLLGSMHAYARDHKLDDVKETIVNLNTSSAYDVFLDEVFGEWAQYLKPEHYIVQMEEGVLDCKYMLTKPAEKKTVVPGAAPTLDDFRAMTREELERPVARRAAVRPAGRTLQDAANRIREAEAQRLREMWGMAGQAVQTQPINPVPVRIRDDEF